MNASADTKAAAQALLGLKAGHGRRELRGAVKREGAQTLSPEQEAVLACSSHRLVLTALAGAGKSRVLSEFVRREGHRRFHYVAFNKSMANEASSLMPSAHCRTLHSIAFSAFGKPYSDKLGLPWNVETLLDWCGAPSRNDEDLAHLIRATVYRFIASDDKSFHLRHVPLQQWQAWQSKKGACDASEILDCAYKVWEGMLHLGSFLPMELDGIVKLMQLSDFVPSTSSTATFLVDESQDLTPCVRSWVQSLPYRVIRAGDPFQSIYGWRMQGLASAWVANGEQQHWLCGSWRFGPQVADLVNPVLNFLGASESLEGLAPPTLVNSEDTLSGVLLARTRVGLVQAAHMEAQKGRSLDFSHVPWLKEYVHQGDELEMEWDPGEDGQWVGAAASCRELLRHADMPGGLKLLTAHVSKGGSFETVRLAEDFCWPVVPRNENGSLAEEARILYVALTRAKKHLSLPGALFEALKSQKSISAPLALEDDGF